MLTTIIIIVLLIIICFLIKKIGDAHKQVDQEQTKNFVLTSTIETLREQIDSLESDK